MLLNGVLLGTGVMSGGVLRSGGGTLISKPGWSGALGAGFREQAASVDAASKRRRRVRIVSPAEGHEDGLPSAADLRNSRASV